MDINEDRIKYVASRTEILRPPRQSLSTFGATNIYYYLVTEPAYSEFVQGSTETVVREGRIIAQKPKIVTPYYLSHLEGFSTEAKKYLDMIINTVGPYPPGLFYTYKNEPKELNIVSDNWIAVVNRLNDEIDRKGDPLASIIKGEDDLWDISLMKFIYELTRNSLHHNVTQLKARGLFDIDSNGVPVDAKVRIEELFRQVTIGEREPRELETELERWNVFEEYQDRFFSLFRGKR